MDTTRIHRATSSDGTQIVGTVEGAGPPLVLVPGGPAAGTLSFRFLVPELADRFTCHSMSPRGRGPSADHPDRSRERLVDDVLAYVESVDAPVTLFGHSSGGVLAIEAAARCESIESLVLYEPAVFDDLDDIESARFAESLDGIRQAVEEASWARAAEIFFLELALANDEEQDAIRSAGMFELMAHNTPGLLREIEVSGLPGLSAPDVPERLAPPVLMLHGTRTAPLYERVARSLAGRFPNARIAAIEGAGHLGPQQHAPAVAAELVLLAAGADGGPGGRDRSSEAHARAAAP